MIQLSDISKTFGTNIALSEINLNIQQGESVALIGPSGSGKTTLLKLLNAQHLCSTGTLSINGQDISKLTPKMLRQLRSNIGYIPQDLGLVSSLKVYQNIMLGSLGKHHALSMLKRLLIPTKAQLREIHQVLQTVGIPEKLYDTTSTLSGGQQQRVAVARALFQHPHTILADEPISSVDPARAKSMIELLKKIAADNNLTILMTLHNIALAKEYFPRILGLRKGMITIDSLDPSNKQLEDLFALKVEEQIG